MLARFKLICITVGEGGRLINILVPYSQSIYIENLKNLLLLCTQKGHHVQKVTDGSLITLNKKPDLILSNQAWWGIEFKIGTEAKTLNIPHITIEHGAPFFYQSNRQYYRRSIGAADLKLLWGKFNLYMMKKYKCPENLLKITGYPRFDDLMKYKPISNSTPRILFLSTWKIPGQISKIWHKTLNQAKCLGYHLAIKHHPQEKINGYQINPDNIPQWVEIIENENLFAEIAKSDFIITSPTSVLIPAIYYKKPLFCYYSPFTKNYWKGLIQFYSKFHFLPKPSIINNFDIEKLLGIKPDLVNYKKMFKYTAYNDDGNNSLRAYNECISII